MTPSSPTSATKSAKNRHPDPRKPQRLASLASQERLEPLQNEPTGIDCLRAEHPDHSIGFGIAVGVEQDVGVGPADEAADLAGRGEGVVRGADERESGVA